MMKPRPPLSPRDPPFRRERDAGFYKLAAIWMVLLGTSFFVIYGGCNAINAHRVHVGSWFFNWERHIPFVPVMIIPYMSIDLFFAGSFFLCRDRAHLRVHAARIILAFALSGAGFLIFPLRYGWARPAVAGWLGRLFTPLNALDQPYNLFPSLHISLRAILWRVYGPSIHSPAWRAALWGWFLLVGLSTLLVYQHHVIDLAGGWLVAMVCCRLFPEKVASALPAAAILQPPSGEPSSLPSLSPSSLCPPTSSMMPLPPVWPP